MISYYTLTFFTDIVLRKFGKLEKNFYSISKCYKLPVNKKQFENLSVLIFRKISFEVLHISACINGALNIAKNYTFEISSSLTLFLVILFLVFDFLLK